MANGTSTAQPAAGGGLYPNLAGGNFGAPGFSPQGRVGPDQAGFGQYGLPQGFGNWSGAARYALAPAAQYQRGTAPLVDYFRGELGKDYQGSLFERSRQQVERGVSEGRRVRSQALTRSGQQGGRAMSPLAASMMQQEEMARSGQLGMAAQQAVFYAQQMKTQAGQQLGNLLAQRMQAMLAPAQFQSSVHSQVPVGTAGPSLSQTALNAAPSFLQALT